jgi:hypothetical protein
MKNVLFTLATLTVFLFSSCSTNEDILQQEPSVDLLKSYTVKRDVTGAYSLDYTLSKNSIAQHKKDGKTNTNEISLYVSDNQSLVEI